MMNPRQLIAKWIGHFNAGDAKALAALYHTEAVNHQVSNEPVIGQSAIKEMFESEFSRAAMHCIIEQIFVDNNWGILEWKDPLGLRGFGFFQFEADLIKFQRGYWDKLSFLRMHKLPIPNE